MNSRLIGTVSLSWAKEPEATGTQPGGARTPLGGSSQIDMRVEVVVARQKRLGRERRLSPRVRVRYEEATRSQGASRHAGTVVLDARLMLGFPQDRAAAWSRDPAATVGS